MIQYTPRCAYHQSRCSLKRQNYDSAIYLLIVSYHESWKTEEWEEKKTEDTQLLRKKYSGNTSPKKATENILEVNQEELLGTKEVED